MPSLNIVSSQNWRTLSWRRIRCLTAGGAGWPPGGSSLWPRRRCSLSRMSWRTEVSPRPRRVSTHIERDIGHWQGQKTCWLPVAAPSYDELCPGAVVGTGCQLWNWCIILWDMQYNIQRRHPLAASSPTNALSLKNLSIETSLCINKCWNCPSSTWS